MPCGFVACVAALGAVLVPDRGRRSQRRRGGLASRSWPAL